MRGKRDAHTIDQSAFEFNYFAAHQIIGAGRLDEIDTEAYVLYVPARIFGYPTIASVNFFPLNVGPAAAHLDV